LSVLVKPTGAACNLDCAYCYFLSKEVLYGAERQQMSIDTLHSHLTRLFAAHSDGQVTIAWQGGEPTLRGLDFFRQAMDLANRLRRPGQTVEHTLQTNGTLLDAQWCEFLAEHRVLVGISIDGPADLHDAHRVNRAGHPTHAQVMRGWSLLKHHGVETNILTTVNRCSEGRGAEVYTYLRDELGARHLQFIPIVERTNDAQALAAERGWRDEAGRRVLYQQEGSVVTSRSVTPLGWGRFLMDVFDQWVARDVGTVFVQHFDVALGNVFGHPTLCVHSPTCGDALAVEFNGDIYACDHFVEPTYLRGNTITDDYAGVLDSPEQREFGQSKLTALPNACRRCSVRRLCHGGCPKDRFVPAGDAEPHHNYLCPGYLAFFSHITPALARMAALLRAGRPARDMMDG
jgi:uncharacterized protein